MNSKFLKRIFSLTMVVMLIASMLPTNVFATSAAGDPFVAPDPTTVACPCEKCNGTTVPDWQVYAGQTATGHYYLKDADYDLQLGQGGISGQVVINLNGYDINCAANTGNTVATCGHFYLHTNATARLDIMDSAAHEFNGEYISGAITGGDSTASTSNTYRRGGNIGLNKAGATVTLHSGAITNGYAQRGGNVYVSAGKFVMKGGRVFGGNTSAGYGSELMCSGNSGYIEIYGGVVTGTRNHPAVQSMYSQINMYGGLIKYTGSDAAMRLNNTSASYNPVTNIYGGEIQGKLSTSDSSGVTTLNIYGGTFSSLSIDADTITHFYNGVFPSSNPAAYRADCACVYKNEADQYVVWPAGHIEGTCSADCAYATAKASYGSYITEQVGEHTLTTNDASSTGYACASCASEMAAPTDIHTEEFYCQKCQDTKNFMPWDGVAANGHYYVEESFTMETVAAVASGEQLCLELNGKEITGASAKRALYVYEGGVLSVQDSSEAKSGKVTGFGTAYAGNGGLLATSGELNLYGGTFSGGMTNTSTQYGGNLYVTGTALITGDAKILDGVSGGHGGNIYITSGGNVTISGNAEIGNGEATAQGGNIYATGAASRLYIRGGLIYGGDSGYAGGNVGINSGAHTYMYSGTIRDGVAGENDGNFGGGNIWVFNAASGSQSTFAMYGGTISGGSSEISGNIICARGDGAAFIYGGTIEDQAANAASDTALREFSCESNRGIIFYNAKVKLNPKSYVASCADYCYADGYYKVWHTGEDHTEEFALVAAADIIAAMTHNYSNATCTTAPTCACGQTTGEALGHAYPETWTDGEKVCANGCGEKITCEHAEFTLAGAVDADCTKPGYTGDKVCNECGMTFESGSEIEQKAHEYGEGGKCVNGCENDKCTNEGHNYTGENGVCVNGCEKTKCENEGHDYTGENGVCVNGCNKTYCDNNGHDFNAETGLCNNGCGTTACSNGHNPGEAKQEDLVEATCQAPGSYKMVVRCTRCNEVISSEDHTIDQLAHDYSGENKVCVNGCGNTQCQNDGCTPAAPVIENNVAPECEKEGSYDTVVYCAVCGEQMSRVTTTVDALEHNPGEAKQEELVEATCQAPGSYKMVVRCTRCNEVLSSEDHTIDQLSHEYDLETGICGNGCNVQATVKVTRPDNTVVFYTDGNAALVAENNSGATLYFLKTTTVKFTTNFKESSLRNVTLATAPGVTLKDNSGTSSGTYYLSNVTLAKDSKFEFNGYPKLTGACHFYGHVDLYMIAVNKNLTVHGDEGAYLRVERNIWVAETMTIIGNDPNTVVFEANYHSGDYNIYADGGVLNVQNAKITCDKFVWNQSDDNPPATVANLTNATIQAGTFSVGKNQSVNMKGNSSIVVSGETSFFSDGYVTMEAGCTFTTATADKQNTGIIVAEGVEGCVYYADGAYTVAAHTYADEWAEGKKPCTNGCGAELSCEHDYVGQITTPATCATKGVKTYTCNDCGASYTEEVAEDATNHADLQQVGAKPATCTAPGHNAYEYCTKCDYTTFVEEEQLQHQWSDWNNGVKTCTRGCGATLECEHDYEAAVTTPATCATKGVMTYTCTECAMSYTEDIEIDAANHVKLVGVDAKPATCLEAGHNAYEYCTGCDYTTFVEEKQKEHNYTYTDNADGTHTVTCDKGCNRNEVETCVDENADGVCDKCNAVLAVYVAVNNFGEKFESLEEAIAARDLALITLLDNVTLTQRVTISGTIGIDLAGFSITGDVADVYGMFYVRKGAELAISGEGTVSNTGLTIGNYGHLRVGESVTVIGGEEDAAIYNFYYAADYYGHAVVSGKANIILNCGALNVMETCQIDYIDNSGNMNINGGTIGELYARDGSDCPGVENAGQIYTRDISFITVPEDYKLVKVMSGESIYKVVAKTYVAEVNGTKFETLAEALAADGEVKLLADVTADALVVAVGETIDLNGKTLTADIIGATIKMNGGNFATSEYLMVGTTEGKYTSTDAVFTIAANETMDMTFISGTVTLNENKWYTLKGQTLTVNAGATFVIPEGKELYVNGSKVIVNGTAANFGTLTLANGAWVKGDIAGTFQMAGGTFETSKYVMIGATEGKYLSSDAKFTIAPNATLDMVIHCGTITLNEAKWYTGKGQTLKIEKAATFVIPEGKELYVNGSNVIVEGTAANFGTLTLANGAWVKGDIAGTFQMAGGTFETSKYVMIGATEGKYLSSDAKFTIAPNATLDMVIHSGTITLNEAKWYTGKGQTLKIEKAATFVIPEGKELYVNGSNVIVEGTAANFGTLTLANGAWVKGDIAGTFQMAGGTFETSKYVMIGATEGKYLSSDAKFTIVPNATMDMTVISGTITLNDADWWTLAGQTLTIAEAAKIVIPEGKNINVQGTVVVNGTADVKGTVTLYNATATVKAAEGLNVVANPAAGETVIYVDGVYMAHNHEYTAVYTAPTNTENGYTTYTCVCGDEYVIVDEGTMLHIAVNVQTGESHTTVQDALDAANSGETVKVLKDAEAARLFVGAGVTLDLNGKKLTVTKSMSASFTTAHIIDSSNGEGLLVLDGADYAFNGSNKYLPVWIDGGVRFVETSFRQRLTYADENTAQFAFYLTKDSVDTILDDILANGSAGTGLSIRIKVTYTTPNGMKATQYFTLTSDMVKQYVQTWDSKAILLTVTGVQGRADLTFTPEIVSTNPNDPTAPSVVIDKVDN